MESSINMGSVECTGKFSKVEARAGGVVGYLYSNIYASVVQNCANYGNVTIGGVFDIIYVGGIVSLSKSEARTSARIRNCINSGKSHDRGVLTGNVSAGGISGKTSKTTVSNCVSHGRITKIKGEEVYLGAISGYESGTFVSCFWNAGGAMAGLKWSSSEKEAPGRPIFHRRERHQLHRLCPRRGRYCWWR